MAATMSAGANLPAATDMAQNTTTSNRKRSRSGSYDAPVTDINTIKEEGRPGIKDLLLDQYITRDQVYSHALQQQQDRAERTLRELKEDVKWFKDFRNVTALDPGRIHGEGFVGYGNSWTAQYPTRIIYPAGRKRPGKRRVPELRVKRADRMVQAEQFDELAPIRLEVEFEKLRLRDTFTWNVYDRTISPVLFAHGLVEDLQIPPEAHDMFVRQINESIQEQIVDHHPHAWFEEEPLDPHLPYHAYKNDDMRITIKLNITIGQHALIDQFEWDINNKMNCPEEFAARMARDMSLSGEFETAIAHQIREQSQMFTKSLYVTGHPFDGRPLENPDVKENMLQSPLPTVFRPYQAAKDYAPYFLELNDAELEKADSALSREQRQLKRSVNRRGGLAMPDLKDRFLQTVRTMVISSVIPGAAENIQVSGVYKPVRAVSGRGRRAGWKTLGEDESDDSEAELSDPESPVRQTMPQGGTARTRGIRGAAAAASVAMRAGYAGSLTPDTEARTSRRFARTIDERDESESPPDKLILRLRLPRERYRQWWRDYKAGTRRPYPGNFLDARGATPYNGMPPPTTPGVGNRTSSQAGYMAAAAYGRATSRQASREASMLAGSPPPSSHVSLMQKSLPTTVSLS